MPTETVKIAITAADQSAAVWGRLQGSLRGVASGLAELGRAATVAAIGAGGGLAAAVKQAINTADEMDKMSSRTGLAVAELSKLAYAANISNVSNEALELGLKALSNNLTEAAANAGSRAATAFAAMGVVITDTEGRVRPLNELMLDLADKFAGYSQSAEKAALAQEVFGKGARGLLPFLDDGRTGIERLQKEAAAFGLEISEGTGKQADEFNDSLTRLAAITKGFALRLAENLLPQLVKLAEVVVGTVKDSDALARSVSQTAEFIRFLATAAIAAWHGCQALGIIIAGVLVSAFELVMGVVRAAIAVFEGWQKTVINLGKSLVDTIRILGGFGEVFARIMARDFSGALERAKLVSEQFLAAVASTVFETLGNIAETGENAGKEIVQGWRNARDTASAAGEQLLSTAESYVERYNSIWNAVASPKPSPTGIDARQKGAAPNPFIKADDVDNYARELERAQEIEQQFRLASLEGYAQVQAQLELDHARRTDQAIKFAKDDEQFLVLMGQNYKAYTLGKRQLEQQTLVAISGIFGNLAQAAKAFGKKGFEAYKIFASAQALINTYSSAVAAYHAMAGIPVFGPALAVAAAASAIAAGLANVAQINATQAVAHGGLDFVPQAGLTTVLAGGERVVQPEANADLTDYLSRGGSGPSTITVMLGGYEVGRALYNMSRDGQATFHPRSVRAEAPA